MNKAIRAMILDENEAMTNINHTYYYNDIVTEVRLLFRMEIVEDAITLKHLRGAGIERLKHSISSLADLLTAYNEFYEPKLGFKKLKDFIDVN